MTTHESNRAPALPVTVAVPVKNEEGNLAKCLDRLGRFSEIVVIDSGSTDRTCDIARKFGARVVNFKWNGQYPKKRNWFLMNEELNTPWVLFVDADEYLDDAFCDELEQAVRREDVDGYYLGYDNYFLGKALHHGLEQRKLALFRVGRALFEKIDEDHWSTLDMEIHEHPIVEGKIGQISTRIDHRDYKGFAHFIDKHLAYAKWEAYRYNRLRQTPEAWEHFTGRQKFKYTNLERWWYPWFYFLFTYVVKRGFLDGGAGFQYSAYKAWYFQTIRLLIQELKSADTKP
ncbi:glycosyltransferase family 2 protein [Rhodobacter maris]|uniref:Glycosyltransferase involved in cell wall bisynthesis n=1 Tax=Rhodobacter maris TaxID=446682 RepID=A0A285TED3_9RHOB|nr:glycosyltransferase family 2 protein [Rhodobacter maris]SOC20402.1 glycosyltransferase involved in cell wall bisynthesis [Rhodobacter maris]